MDKQDWLIEMREQTERLESSPPSRLESRLTSVDTIVDLEGIKKRRVLYPGCTVGDMAKFSAHAPADIDALIEEIEKQRVIIHLLIDPPLPLTAKDVAWVKKQIDSEEKVDSLLVRRAKQAVNDVFSDTSVTQEETLESLKEIVVQEKIIAIQEALRDKR